jgi:hypothetical protein
VNLGLIAFAGTANVLVPPTAQHEATIAALDNLRPDNSTAIGEALFSALDSIATVAAVLSSNATPPPARIVLLSDGKENKPGNPNNPRGAYTAARAAKDQGVPVSTISFGTTNGFVEVENQRLPVPVDPEMLQHIAQMSGGQSYKAKLRRGARPGWLPDRARPRQRRLAAPRRAVRDHRCPARADDQPTTARLKRPLAQPHPRLTWMALTTSSSAPATR